METCAVMVVPCPERAAAAPAGPAAPGRPARRCPRRVGTATARAAPGRPATIGGPSTRAARTGRRSVAGHPRLVGDPRSRLRLHGGKRGQAVFLLDLVRVLSKRVIR